MASFRDTVFVQECVGQPMNETKRRDELIIAHETFVRRVVLKTMKTLGLPTELLEEYLSAAYLGLVEAAQRFDPSTNVPFDKFAFLRVRGAVIDYIREHSPLTGKAYRYAKSLQAMEGIEEETTALLRNVKDPKKIMARILSFAAQGAISYRLCSFQSQAALDQMVDDTTNVETQLMQKQLAERIKDIVKTLPEKERFIIERYYFEEKTFGELLQERPELSKSWLSRLHSRALNRLNALLMELNSDE